MIRTLPVILDNLAAAVRCGLLTTERIARNAGLDSARARARVSDWLFTRTYEPRAATALRLAAEVDKLRVRVGNLSRTKRAHFTSALREIRDARKAKTHIILCRQKPYLNHYSGKSLNALKVLSRIRNSSC